MLKTILGILTLSLIVLGATTKVEAIKVKEFLKLQQLNHNSLASAAALEAAESGDLNEARSL